jgi:hypothetical protein
VTAYARLCVFKHNSIFIMPGKGRQGNNAKLAPGESAGKLQKAADAASTAVNRAQTPFQRMQELLASRQDNGGTPAISTVDGRNVYQLHLGGNMSD